MKSINKLVFTVGLSLMLLILFPSIFIFANETTSNDPFFDLQWGLYNDGSRDGAFAGIDIAIKKAWEKFGVGKREVIVAVLDTGVDFSHEDFRDAFWTNNGEIAGNGIDDDRNGFIDDIHGWNFYNNTNNLYDNEFDAHSTHVTGIIAANRNHIGISGIVGSSKVKIMVLKVLGGKDESGYTEAIGNAIRYAEKNGADICNLSFGTVKSDRNLMDAIKNSKMLFITAAGNGDKRGQGYDIDISPVYPAAYHFSNIITVANLKSNGYLNRTSNYGVKSVDLAAPGTDIFSTIDWTTFRNKDFLVPYDYLSGTSMAVPMVTGVAAMLYSAYPELSLTEVKEAILGGVVKLNTLQNVVRSGGTLNADKSMEYCEEIILPRLLETKNRVVEGEKNETTRIEKQKKLILREDKGSAPKIIIRKGKNKKIRFFFTDNDNDIWKIRYSTGRMSKYYFKKGRKGRTLTAKSGGKKGLTLSKGKTYTLYVIDKKGNEVIKVIRFK